MDDQDRLSSAQLSWVHKIRLTDHSLRTTKNLAKRGVFCYHCFTMKRSELTFTLALVPFDYLALLAAGIAAYFSRFHPAFTSIRPVIFDLTLQGYLKVVTPMVIVFVLVFTASGLYSVTRRSIASELSRIVLACSASMALVFAITFFSRVLFESRWIAIAGWGLAIVFVALERLVVRALQRSLLRLEVGTHRIVIIGKTSAAEALIHEFAQKKRLGFRVVGHYKDFTKTLANELRKMKRDDRIDEIVLANPESSRQETLEIIAFTEQEHLGFRYCADLFTAAIGRSIIHTYAGIPVIEVQKTPLDGWGAIYKRIFDVTASLILIILASPIMLLTALFIKLDSRGPVFFARLDDGSLSRRVGQGGRPFTYFKFRSMRPGTHALRYRELADADTRKGSPLVKIKDDPRITRVGKFIRKFSIDELPEFFLVLRGHMSLVGPRPHLPEEVDRYKPEQRKVLTIKPGITGMAQISGRADLDFDDEVRLDTYYIEHWSPWLDLYILLKTPLVVLFGRGAS
ncbi:MAG: Undecaprenyl-phosphate glucose phosphotransferase [Candidatus Uhrbacteria bacterium GW2011_GWA2_52_8d]|uniref:Undecaprenyl-phosphate glucose phosphotransferase n=1 Tax=Candidatus Uhrbacteria bacterium GW2011_GWA2_52_8d TaxID=1618979 RepID=A0A0G1XR51_9BACT|nr:MAG: Undecaprenyl-phosphate glucose phosphotransferase [Candidatus Uhrbacteria bacterium GW2011_GWA2_52_8d]